MALTITKNDINRVYGTPYTPTPKITKGDLDTVYGTPPSYTDIQRSSLPNLIKQQTSGLSTPVTHTAKEKYGNSLYVPASPYAVENEKRNKLNYIVNENLRHTSGWGMNNPYSQLDYINESERAAISDLIAQKNYDSAYDYYEKISKDLNKRQAESEYRQVKGFAEKYPVTSLVTNALSTPFKTFEYGVNLAEYADNKLEDKSTYFDKNSPTFSTSRYSEAVTDSIMKDTGIIGQIARSAFASASNQYAVSKVVGAGPLTELFMAGRTAQDSLYQNAKRGVDGDKSVVNSLGKAAISYGTERYFPSEKLMGVKADDAVNTLWKSYKTAALSKGIEEIADNIITNLWDSVQLGNQSEISQLIHSYQQQGYSKSSAVVKAGVEKYVVDSLIGFLTGATAGGITSYGVNKVNTLKHTLTDGDRLGIIHKDFLPLINENESNGKNSVDNSESDSYYKAYSQEVDRRMSESLSESDTREKNTNNDEYSIEGQFDIEKDSAGLKYDDVEQALIDSVSFEIEYGKLSNEDKNLYDLGKSGDGERAVSFAKKVIVQESIDKLKVHGADVYILPITKPGDNVKNKNGLAFATHISAGTGQIIFKGVYQLPEISTKKMSVWERMKQPYSKFDFFDGISYTDIIGRKFILVDDNVTTGHSFIGLRQFIEENGGQVVDYYAPTKGIDRSEKLIATDETWNKILELNAKAVAKGKPNIYEFAKMNKLKREISQKGLTEREAEEFYERYRMVGGDD